MTNVELHGNKKAVILKLLEDGDMSIYDIRDMKLVNHTTKKRITPTGVNKLVQKLCEIGATVSVPSEEGDVYSANKSNIVCKRSTEHFKFDVAFLLALSAAVTVMYFLAFNEIFFAIGSLSTIAATGVYLFLKAASTHESKSVFVNVKNSDETLV